MKYTQDEAVKEILRREERLVRRRSRIECAALSGLSSLLAVLLLLTVLLFPANRVRLVSALGRERGLRACGGDSLSARGGRDIANRPSAAKEQNELQTRRKK